MRKVKVAGVTVRVGTAAECETAEICVVMRQPDPGRFTDNERGVCSRCGHGVYFRPHVPKRPPKVCVWCAYPLVKRGYIHDA